MSEQLKELIEKARLTQMTPEQIKLQRESFAYGNTKLSDENMTRETIQRASATMQERSNEQPQRPSEQRCSLTDPV